jgi:tetratricopeptide (TPR) repeat protein
MLTCALLFTVGGWTDAHADGPEPGQSAPRPAVAETMENARLLVAIGHFDEALSLLRMRRTAGPSDTELLFLLGVASAGKVQHMQVVGSERQALLNEAVAAFRQVLAVRPEYVRARIELATVFFLMEDDRLAREHFEQALADELPSWVAEHIQQFLAKMDARKR